LNKIIVIVIILIIIIIVPVLTIIYIKNLELPNQDHDHYYAYIEEDVNVTADYWNVTILDYVDSHNEDDIKYFIYLLSFPNGYKETQWFDELKINKSKYFYFDDVDQNDKISKNDMFIIKKHFDNNKTDIIHIEILHYSYIEKEVIWHGIIQLDEDRIEDYY
jgi:hypothetical protein